MDNPARLKLAVQKSGRLTDQSIDLLGRCGLKFSRGKDQLVGFGENMPLDLLFVRDDDIPDLVEEDVCDLGLVGLNVVEEKRLELAARGHTARFEILRTLDFGRCRLALAVPEEATWWTGPPSRLFGHRQGEPTTAEIERTQDLETCRVAARSQFQALFFDHVEAHEPQIADIFFDEVGNIVIAHEQQVERHVLAKADELIFAARELQATTSEQIDRLIGQPSGLLHGEFESCWVVHDGTSALRRRGQACVANALYRDAITTITAADIARDACNRGDADPGNFVDFPIGQAALQPLDHGPAVGHRLQLRWRAQIAKERAAFLDIAQGEDRLIKAALGARLLAR